MVRFFLMNKKGFTLLELVIVIISISILFFALTHRHFSKNLFSSKVASDQVIADIKYTQILAMAVSYPKSITFHPGSSKYVLDGEEKNLPAGVVFTTTTLPSHTLTFNSIGEPVFPDNFDRFIYFSDGGKIKIYALTGNVE